MMKFKGGRMDGKELDITHNYSFVEIPYLTDKPFNAALTHQKFFDVETYMRLIGDDGFVYYELLEKY